MMKKLLLPILSFILSVQCVFAATIKGKMLDENNAPMIGAHVIVTGTDKYAIVGLNGQYEINNVSVGSYKLIASFIGYLTEEREVAISQEKQVVVLDIGLKPDLQLLTEFEVIGEHEKGSVAEARQAEKNAPNVMNVISAKTIELLPDITVANLAQRVSGVTITRNSNGDQQYAIVRGMDKRYNYTMVNGVKIPSPDNKNRFVPLDIFPATLLEKLEVHKVLIPSMEGDAVGGVINMVMKDAPNKFMVNADLQLGYNQINLNRKFLQFDRSDINKASPLELYGPLYQAQFSDFSKSNGVVKPIQPLPDVLGSVSIGNRFLNGKLGVLVAGSYQNTYRGSNSIWFKTLLDFLGSNSPILDELHERTYSTQQTRYAIHTRIDYKFNKRHKLKLYVGDYVLQSAETRDDFVSQLDARYYNAEKGNAIVSLKTRTRYINQNILTGTLQGEHEFARWFNVNWSVVKSLATNDEPDIIEFERNTGLTGFELGPVTIERHMPRTWQHNSDNDATAYLNLIFKPSFFYDKGEIAVGGMYRDKKRTNFFNQYSFDPSPTTQTYGVDWENYEQVTQTVLNPLGSTANPLNYTAHENLLDYYIQFKYLFFTKTEIVGGIRFEHTNQGYELTNPIDPNIAASMDQVYVDPLPSANLKHKLNQKTNLRASYFKSISRPSYYEIVPFQNSTQNEGYSEIGNPDLKRAKAHNLDFRYEYFPNATDQILLGAFYKKINDPIEYAAVFTSSNSLANQPGNYGTANNWGFEADFTKFFNKFGIKVNYTFTHSRITTTKAIIVREIAGDSTSQLVTTNVEQTRPLQGQAQNIGNLSLLYKDQKAGLNLQLSVVYTGEHIVSISPFLDTDAWSKPFTQVGFSAEKKIGKRFVATLKIQNLLNAPYEVIIKQPHAYPSKDYILQDSPNSTLVRRDQFFQTYRLGLKLNI
ncbi:MAG: TonB-dependent receptor [Salibacteraceae bacterium]|nr:TonB-dependent receptor [Salibacteraceae bacterium]